MSNRSKKAQFSRSLKKKSIHIGGKSEKVPPPPLKKPTSVLDNHTANEMRSLKERIAQRKELNILFFQFKQMADFLENDINQFNSDLYLTNQKLSVSDKIVSPQEHLLCERAARKIVGSTYNNNYDFYDLNYIKTNHKLISSTKDSLYETTSNTERMLARILFNDSYDDYNKDNVVYNNWLATLLPVLQIQHYMAIQELRSLKKDESCIASNLFTTTDDLSEVSSRGHIVLDSFYIACNFASALEQLVIQKDLTDSLVQFAKNINILATMNRDNVEFHSEQLDPLTEMSDSYKQLMKKKELFDLSTEIAPSPDIYISFDDCFDANCSNIDVDRELSQLDLSNDPSLAASIRKVYCDFNELLQQQSIAQKQVTTIECPIAALSHEERFSFIHKKSLLLAESELFASAAKPVEKFHYAWQQNDVLQQLDDTKQAFVNLNNIINIDITTSDSISAENYAAAQNIQEYQRSCIALFAKERSFYANIGAQISAKLGAQIRPCVDLLPEKEEFNEVDSNFFNQFVVLLLTHDKCIHCSNIRVFAEILDNLDNQSDQDLNLDLITDINQTANTANLFKVITRFLHCFIYDDYEFARFIVDAYNKPAQQSDLDKLLNKAQLALESRIELLKDKYQAPTSQAENVAANEPADTPSELAHTPDRESVKESVQIKSAKPQTPEQHSGDDQAATKGDTESESAKAKPSKAKAAKAKAKTKATTAKASTKDDSAAAQKSSVSAADATALSPSEQGITLLNAQERKSLMAALAAQNPNPKSELNYSNPFELLCAVVLSAQATDASVNLVTPELFAAAPTPEKMAALGEEAIGNLIKRVGLWRNKAKNLAQLAAILHEEYNDQVPDSFEELIKLPGVGAKTARVVLNVAFGQPYIAVDTHVFRVCNRTGLCLGNTAEKVAKHLPDLIDPEFLMNAHHYLLLHGRYVCTAKNFEERCATCVAAPWCKHNYPKD